MSDSKREKQRDMRIRQDKIELIKAKQGMAETEVNIKEEPREYTSKEKAANFWFYNKVKIIIVLLLAALVIGIIYGLATVVRADYNILFLTPDYEVGNRYEEIQAALTKYAEDINGDGQVKVRVEFLPLNKNYEDNATVATEYSANFSRALAEFQSGNIVLVIADEKIAEEQNLGTSLEDLSEIIQNNDNIKKLGLYFKNTKFAEEINDKTLPDSVFIGIRKMVYDKSYTDKMQKNYDAGIELLKKMAEDLSN